MKNIIVLWIVIFVNSFSFTQLTLTKKWESDTSTIIKPESVLYDPKTNSLFISNMDIGTIDRFDVNGKIIKNDWLSGLQSNKGMGIYKGLLYTAETSAVAVIDIKKGSVVKRIPIPEAIMLNDLAIDRKGLIYVSDTRAGKVYKIENEVPTVYLENIKGANGLLTAKNGLIILSSTSILQVNEKKEMTTIAQDFEGGLDGIVSIGKNKYIVSNYKGILYLVNDDSSKEILLDTREQNIMMNDIDYNKKTKTLYIPSYNKNKVVTYKMNE
jgi:sugar lactone lactonase YvrE